MAELLTLRKFEALGPFEIKNELISLAKDTSRTTQSAFLNAGRGNPNWIATEPREAFFLLGQFAITESRRVMELRPGSAACRRRTASLRGSRRGLQSTPTCPARPCCPRWSQFAVKKFSFDRDAFVHELVDSIIGDNYPVPDRMLVHNERIVHEYLMWAMCGEPRPSGKFDLYAVEGGTAAMCYIFKSLKANRLLFPGDTIALGTPIFTPYLEMTHLEDYALKVVNIAAPQENRFQYTDEEIKKLEDPKIKAFFIVNPGNPTRHGDEQGNDRQDRQPREDEAPGPDAADRRRLRNLRRRFPLAARRASPTTRSASTPTPSISAAPAGGSA